MSSIPLTFDVEKPDTSSLVREEHPLNICAMLTAFAVSSLPRLLLESGLKYAVSSFVADQNMPRRYPFETVVTVLFEPRTSNDLMSPLRPLQGTSGTLTSPKEAMYPWLSVCGQTCNVLPTDDVVVSAGPVTIHQHVPVTWRPWHR